MAYKYFVDELLTIKIHMPSVLGDSSELIQFVENTGLTSVQFLSCYRGLISFLPDVDTKKALVASDPLLRKAHVNQIAHSPFSMENGRSDSTMGNEE